MIVRVALLVSAALLAACQPAAQQAAPSDAAPPNAAPVPAPAPSSSTTGATSGTAPPYDERVVNFGGYASARFNEDADAVRRAWGKPLAAMPAPESPDACHYLMTQARNPQGFGLAFMLEGGKFVRYDVDTPSVVAPGGIVVGRPAERVRAAFGPNVQVHPHKYVENGQVLVVAPADGGEARLVFEADAQGVITSWRIGLEPQVHYVEGCS